MIGKESAPGALVNDAEKAFHCGASAASHAAVILLWEAFTIAGSIQHRSLAVVYWEPSSKSPSSVAKSFRAE